MTTKVAINGFGRIGRNVLRIASQSDRFEVVAINDLTDPATIAHLLKYDSVHGTFAAEVTVENDILTVAGRPIRILQQRDPKDLPWAELDIDIVIEATGLFTKRDDAARHLDAGARRVVISAPGKQADATLCMGINHTDFDPARHTIISNASCTTNCLAPVAKVLDERFGIERGMMTTVHAYTNDQRILDLPHRDLRRARAAALSIIPTTTGAAAAIGLVLPQLDGKLSGMSIRVPTPNVSLIDLVVEVSSGTDVDGVNAAIKQAAEHDLKGILDYCSEPLVARDFLGSSASATFDALSTTVLNDTLIKVLAWYDNEWGYSHRVCDLTTFIAQNS
ncbi:MAG: type I glyceraldehyde-3-phosphate dehydrogenase [Desulfuromonas sp.]|nr:MAG: type I glyceraldehyde-3-phosphate dehydrogenase [Desulfuromonas sp.]